MVGEERMDAAGVGGVGAGAGGGAGGDMARADTITLSSVVRRRDLHADAMNAQQATDQHNLSVEQLGLDANAGNLSQEGPSGAYSEQALRLRRAKLFKRQGRVLDERDLRRQASEPVPSSSAPTLQKHESYPQYSKSKRTREEKVGSLLIRAVTVIDRQPAATGDGGGGEAATARASHTPAVRSGPPLSCNFCWNTVDDCGRILRRKTQYHCPECRTNLCIVPCFHEYHDGARHTAAESPAPPPAHTPAPPVKPEPITCKPSILDH